MARMLPLLMPCKAASEHACAFTAPLHTNNAPPTTPQEVNDWFREMLALAVAPGVRRGGAPVPPIIDHTDLEVRCGELGSWGEQGDTCVGLESGAVWCPLPLTSSTNEANQMPGTSSL